MRFAPVFIQHSQVLNLRKFFLVLSKGQFCNLQNNYVVYNYLQIIMFLCFLMHLSLLLVRIIVEYISYSDLSLPRYIDPIWLFTSISIVSHPIIIRTVEFYLTNNSSHFHFVRLPRGSFNVFPHSLSLVRHWASWEILFSRCIFPAVTFPRSSSRLFSFAPSSSSLHGILQSRCAEPRKLREYSYAKILGRCQGLCLSSFFKY